VRFAAASALALAVIAVPAPAATQAKDWTKTVALSPDDGFVVGNPAAPVKLVEYGSLTCPHCAHFSEESSAPLMTYVRSGKVAFEFRNYVLNGIDMAATRLAHCAGTKGFFPFVEKLYDSQPTWLAKIVGLPVAEQQRINGLGETGRLVALARAGDLLKAAAVHGVTAVKARQCLSDPKLGDRLTALHDAGSAAGVQGTPTFFLNGQQLPVNAWPDVDAAIRQAMGERG